MTTFLLMYHPLIPSTEVTPARVPVQAIDENAARGWLLVDPDGVLPTPSTPYYTKEALLSQIQGGAAPIGTALRAASGPLGDLRAFNIYQPHNYGAVGGGTTDDSNAFRSMTAAVKATLRTVPHSLQPEQSVTAVVKLGPVDYLITDPGALLGDESMVTNGRGLRVVGAHAHASNIIFKPAAAGTLMTNDYWMFATFKDVGFLAATSGCTFLLSNTTHGAQRFTFEGCRWQGWKYGVDLRGSDNNSEFAFTDYAISAQQNDGAFFYIGASGSDQFLNYWFDRGSYVSTSAPFIDAEHGGHFHITDLDAPNWGGSLSAQGFLFNLRGLSHGEGMCAMTVKNVRWEAASDYAAIINSEWPQGNITFDNFDMSALTLTYTYGDVIVLNVENVDSAVFAVKNSQMAGSVRIKMGPLTYAHKHVIKFEDTTWLQKASPSDVVVYDTSNAGGNTLPTPAVQFIRCRNRANDVWATTGAAVWDATIGHLGEASQDLKQRTLSVRGPYGIAWGTEAQYVRLPVGALITGLEVMSPAGAVSEADGGTWTVATTEGTPTTVATATVAGALSAGFDVSTAVSPPFKCGTTAQATLKVSATNVTQSNAGGLLLIKGYW